MNPNPSYWKLRGGAHLGVLGLAGVATGWRRVLRSSFRNQILQKGMLEGGTWVCSSACSSGFDGDGDALVLPEKKQMVG
jgi:hypothetical protein